MQMNYFLPELTFYFPEQRGREKNRGEAERDGERWR